MKKRVLALVLTLLLALSLCACGQTPSNNGGNNSDAPKQDPPQQDQTQQPAQDAPAGRVNVMYWCPYTGNGAERVQKIIDGFNGSQDKYFVQMEYNGGYFDQLAKLQATDKANLPALCNSSSETVGSYLHSGFIRNVQEFIDADPSYDRELYGNLISTYGVDGELIGYPLGLSLSGFFYNADIFEAAGIDPYSLTSMDRVYDAAIKICEGGYAPYAIAEEHSGIWANYAFHREGFYTVDNDNGASGLPTRCLYDDNSNGFADIVTNYYQEWADLAAKGYMFPFGSKIKEDMFPALGRSELAMIVTTNSYLTQARDAAAEGNIKFGFVPMFSATDNGKQTGYCSSGNGFFIVDNGNTEEQQGAWEFIKYFTSPDVQVEWNLETGYLPLYDEIYNAEGYQAFLADEDYAYVNRLIEALQTADNSAFYAFVANNNEYTPAGATCLEAVINGTPVDQAIATMCDTINMAFEMYNATNG